MGEVLLLYMALSFLRYGQKVLVLLIRRELLRPELAERQILSLSASQIFYMIVRSPGGDSVFFSSIECRIPIAHPTCPVFDIDRSILTSPDVGCTVVREERIGFQHDIEFTTRAVRKMKSYP